MARAKTPSSQSRPGRHVPRPRVARTAGTAAEARRAYARVRALCLGHAGVYEKEAWSEPTFRVERGKMFLMFADNHHGDGRTAFWCMATPDAREAFIAVDAERFFVPPYVGPSGWIGVRLEGDVPWDMVEEIIADAARLGSPAAGAPSKSDRIRRKA